MYQYYLCVGTAKNNDYNNVTKAVDRLKKYRIARFVHSEFYLAESSYYSANNLPEEYLTVSVYMDSDLHPFELLDKFNRIKRRIPKIYIDIVWIKNMQIISNSLKIPNYKLLNTSYVLSSIEEVIKEDYKLKCFIKKQQEKVKDKAKKISKYHLKRM